MSARSLARIPTNLYAYHAVGHAYQARGDYRERAGNLRARGLARALSAHPLAPRRSAGHPGPRTDYARLLGSHPPALPLYERIELLWRLEVLRHAPVDEAVWRDLAEQGERVLVHADYLTIWMHHWIGLALARAGDTGQGQAVKWPAATASPRAGPAATGPLWGPPARGRVRHHAGRLRAAAARLMAPAVQQIHAMGGGSREQKDIFRDVFLELQRRLGHADEVIELAQQRLLANPRHTPSLAALAWAYDAKGDADPPPAGLPATGASRRSGGPGPGIARATRRASGPPSGLTTWGAPGAPQLPRALGVPRPSRGTPRQCDSCTGSEPARRRRPRGRGCGGAHVRKGPWIPSGSSWSSSPSAFSPTDSLPAPRSRWYRRARAGWSSSAPRVWLGRPWPSGSRRARTCSWPRSRSRSPS